MPIKFDKCPNLFNNLIINPYGDLMACCGLVCEQIPFLRLGNIKNKSIKSLYSSAFHDLIKIWLYIEGPAKILKYISEKQGTQFEFKGGHLCAICKDLFKNSNNITFLRTHYNEYYSSVLLKYFMHTNSLNSIK